MREERIIIKSDKNIYSWIIWKEEISKLNKRERKTRWLERGKKEKEKKKKKERKKEKEG